MVYGGEQDLVMDMKQVYVPFYILNNSYSYAPIEYILQWWACSPFRNWYEGPPFNGEDFRQAALKINIFKKKNKKKNVLILHMFIRIEFNRPLRLFWANQ